MDIIKEAEELVDILLLDQFNPSHLVSNAMGHYNVGWTQCFENRCEGQELSFDKEICKQACIISAASASVAEIAGGRGACGKVKKPGPCIKRLDKGIDRLRDKITNARDKQRKARDKKAEYLRKMAGGA